MSALRSGTQHAVPSGPLSGRSRLLLLTHVPAPCLLCCSTGNYIVDLFFKSPIKDAPKAAEELKNTCGVFEHGLFCGMSTAVIIAGSDGISVKEA